jgi:hypothetical protein
VPGTLCLSLDTQFQAFVKGLNSPVPSFQAQKQELANVRLEFGKLKSMFRKPANTESPRLLGTEVKLLGWMIRQ